MARQLRGVEAMPVDRVPGLLDLADDPAPEGQ
jgi:hypothetical protein